MAAGLSRVLLWLPWSCLEPAVSIAWQPGTLLNAVPPAAPASVWADAPHKTSSGGGRYVLILIFWNNTKYSVPKFICASTEARCTEV